MKISRTDVGYFCGMITLAVVSAAIVLIAPGSGGGLGRCTEHLPNILLPLF